MSFTRPMCDTKGCETISSFHGFGRDVCWQCYARLLENGGFYHLTQGERERIIARRLTPEEKDATGAQLSLQWGER
jgi:hypothetical protein